VQGVRGRVKVQGMSRARAEAGWSEEAGSDVLMHDLPSLTLIASNPLTLADLPVLLSSDSTADMTCKARVQTVTES
jgi:hypothetical protein